MVALHVIVDEPKYAKMSSITVARGISAVLSLLPAALLAEVWRCQRRCLAHKVRLQASDVSAPSAEAAFLERVRTVVEGRLHDSRFRVEGLAGELGLSSRQLQRRLRTLAQVSAAELIRTMRLERAVQLLTQQAGMVAEVAYATGFQDPKHFSKLFRQVYGVPPSQYRAGRT